MKRHLVRTYYSGTNRSQSLCKVCYGQPWARTSKRWLDHPGGQSVTGDGMLCSGCGEPYAPEPPPERCSVLGSSAGTAVRSGELHGVTRVR